MMPTIMDCGCGADADGGHYWCCSKHCESGGPGEMAAFFIEMYMQFLCGKWAG